MLDSSINPQLRAARDDVRTLINEYTPSRWQSWKTYILLRRHSVQRMRSMTELCDIPSAYGPQRNDAEVNSGEMLEHIVKHMVTKEDVVGSTIAS